MDISRKTGFFQKKLIKIAENQFYTFYTLSFEAANSQLIISNFTNEYWNSKILQRGQGIWLHS